MVGNGAIPVKFGEAAVTQEEIHLDKNAFVYAFWHFL
jgi:hypothetical protein